MDAYSFLSITKPPQRAPLFPALVQPLNEYILASTGIRSPEHQTNATFPALCLIGDASTTLAAKRNSDKTALIAHLHECVQFRDQVLHKLQVQAAEICSASSAGEDAGQFGSLLFDMFHEGAANTGVADVSIQSAMNVLTHLADARITTWEACTVSLQQFQEKMEGMKAVLQALTARLPSPHAFSTMTENIASSVSAIRVFRATLLAMITRVTAIRKVFVFLVSDGERSHDDAKIAMSCGAELWTELYEAAKEIQDGLQQ